METQKRIISFFIWDPELERKIDCEIKMIDGISKLLNVATNFDQIIQCHKALILSQQRILAFMSEIQRKQQNLLQSDRSEIEPTKARIILSDIHLPLYWTTMKAKSEQKKFAVFCLARIGCEILDTKLQTIDKQSTEIIFSDKLIFENIPHNFQLNLEVYALNTTLALSSSAKDFANRYSTFFSTNFARRFLRRNPNHTKSSNDQQSKFVLIAQTILTKESIFKLSKLHSFKLSPRQENSLFQLPISSSFTSYFIVLPLCYTRLVTYSGIIQFENIYYAGILTRGYFEGEEIMENNLSQQHRFSIAITPDTIIHERHDRLSFIVDNHEFIVQDQFTLKYWIQALQQHIVDIREWQCTFEHQPSTRRFSSITPTIQQQNLTYKSRSLDDLLQKNPIINQRRIDNNNDSILEYHTYL